MKYKVMIADDESIMRKAMSSLIDWNALDLDVICLASNGQEIMQKLKEGKPDILILDIQMPGMTGIEIAKYVWEQKLPIKVILLTAYSDFSYAQQAIKYGVVDYVVKTGAFESLVSAVEKTKEQLVRERHYRAENNITALRENFFRAVLDGSLYIENEIKKNAEELDLHFESGYLAVLIHFRMEEDAEGEKGVRNQKSLLNFLRMAFDSQMILGMTAGRNRILIILSAIPEVFQPEMDQKCCQVVDMMENFMNRNVYIGMSRRSEDIMELKKQFEHAEYAVGDGFFAEKSKIIYYNGITYANRDYREQMEKEQNQLYYFIKKGKKEEALAAFCKLLGLQKMAGGSAGTILDSGIHICTCCKKILSEFDKCLYDMIPYRGNIEDSIHQCRHVSEYSGMMETMIGKTAEYVNIASGRKNTLIYECEKYIEANFQKCITVADAARNIGASPSYLSRIFKEATGDTIINFINKKKIDKAKEYLLETDMKIYEIADALGFENTTYFSHFFKKYTEISPKDYKSNTP